MHSCEDDGLENKLDINIPGVNKVYKLVKNSKEIIDELTKIIGCDRNWFTIEHQNTEYIFDGKIVDGYTFVELYWFARDEKIKKEVADFLTKFIKKINNNKDCCIIFFTLTGDNYCDNGKFF